MFMLSCGKLHAYSLPTGCIICFQNHKIGCADLEKTCFHMLSHILYIVISYVCKWINLIARELNCRVVAMLLL